MRIISLETAKKHLIVGLGNPGKEYDKTRHNIGFEVIEAFAQRHGMAFGSVSKGAQSVSGQVLGGSVSLLKPLTYMNNSGEPLMQYLRYHAFEPGQIIAVVDDIHLPLGKIRLRAGGSEGGHNGLKSLTAHLHTRDYPRLRVGVGEPGSSGQQIDYVLGRFGKSEMAELESVIADSAAALEAWIQDGIEAAMNRFN